MKGKLRLSHDLGRWRCDISQHVEIIHHDWGGEGKGLLQQKVLQPNRPECQVSDRQRRWQGILTALYGRLFAHKLVSPH